MDFEECPSLGICLMFFSGLGWGYGFLRGRPQRCSPLLITAYPDACRQSTRLVTIGVGLDAVAEVVSVRFLHSALLFFSLHTVLCGRTLLCTASPHLRSGGLFPSLRGVSNNYRTCLEWPWM